MTMAQKVLFFALCPHLCRAGFRAFSHGVADVPNPLLHGVRTLEKEKRCHADEKEAERNQDDQGQTTRAGLRLCPCGKGRSGDESDGGEEVAHGGVSL